MSFKQILQKIVARINRKLPVKKEKQYQYLIDVASNEDCCISIESKSYGLITNNFIVRGLLSKKVESSSLFVVNSFTKRIFEEVELTIKNRSITVNLRNLDFISLEQNNSCIFKLIYKPNAKKRIILASFAISFQQYLPKAIFVVGSPRSGTTAVGASVQNLFSTKTHLESHIAPYFSELLNEAIVRRKGNLASRNRGTLINEVLPVELELEFHKMVKNIHSSFYGQELVIDKTPGHLMILSLPLLLRIYPNAKVIYCQRRGLENIQSRMRKFPKTSFKSHCNQWLNSMRAWERTKKLLNNELGHENWYYELEQFELLHHSADEINRIASFLNAEKEPTLKAIKYLEKKSPQQTSDNKLPVSLDKTDWSTDEKDYFNQKCAKMMERNNYSLDENYYLSSVGKPEF